MWCLRMFSIDAPRKGKKLFAGLLGQKVGQRANIQAEKREHTGRIPPALTERTSLAAI